MTESDLPPLVQKAMAAASEVGFPLDSEHATGGPSASAPGVGQTLAMLAAACHDGRIGESGTGTGVGAAWMVSAMPASATLITVENDPTRAEAARRVFAHDPRVTVVHGDAAAALPRSGPYDLLFIDGGGLDPAAMLDLVRPGGRIVVDDVTPMALLPPDSTFRTHDPKRAFFARSDLVSAEIVLPDLRRSMLVGTKVGDAPGR